MIDRPVIGQLGRADDGITRKIEIIGELKGKEWAEFVRCIKECTKRFPGLIVKENRYKSRMPYSFIGQKKIR